MSDITALREALFAQLAELRATPTGNVDALRAAISKAQAIGELAKSITDTGRLEVDYLRLTGGNESKFLALTDDGTAGASPPAKAGGNGIVGITRHVLRG